MVTKDTAIKGRATALKVADTHYVLKGNRMSAPFPDPMRIAVFATGCFWGTEKGFWRLPGVYSTAVGYCAGFTENPTYEEVCSGQTGHTEAVQVVYDPTKISYVDLLRLYWQSHDPTQGMGQGNDRGTQYRSGVYPTDDVQRKLADASKAVYEQQLGRTITSEVKDKVKFYYAEDYHQQYLAKPGSRKYCSAQPTGVQLKDFKEWAPEGIAADGEHRPRLSNSFWAKHGPTPSCTINVPDAPIEWDDAAAAAAEGGGFKL